MPNYKKWLLVELLAVFFLIMLYLWWLYKVNSWLALIPVAAVIFSLGRQCLKTRPVDQFAKDLGFLPETISGVGSLAAAATLITLAVAGIGLIFNPDFLKNQRLRTEVPSWFFAYVFWALIQQVGYQGYLIHRLNQLLDGDRVKTAWLGGLIFATIHAPNPVLVTMTFCGGVISALFFLRNRFIYPIALMHGALAVAIGTCLPEEWHQNLTLGYYYLEKLNSP